VVEGGAGFCGSVDRGRGTGMEEQSGWEWKSKTSVADMRCCGDMLKVRGHIFLYM